MIVSFFVTGEPKQKGSARGFQVGKRIVITNDCKREKPWAQQVHWTAREHGPELPWEAPVGVDLTFHMARPKRLLTRKALRLSDVPHIGKPDVDKLVRSVLDALTGVFWVDDSRVVEIFARKAYADYGKPAGVTVVVERLEDRR